jgi:putative FmdB family regulatory protein
MARRRAKTFSAIRTVLDGHRYLSAKMTDQLLGVAGGGGDPTHASPVEKLTDREREVYTLIGQAVTTSSIAKQLHLSPHTIDSRREKIKSKLGLKNGAELTRRAVQWLLENR